MINGLGIIGWGVGGIEALAAMLEYPSEFPIPDVIGVRLLGSLSNDATPTDLTLNLTARLRELGVVGKFVEVFGESVGSLPVETRAMIANMSPESGATMTYFPVDNQTINYLERTGRSRKHAELVREYFRLQGLFRDETADDPLNILTYWILTLVMLNLYLPDRNAPMIYFHFPDAENKFREFLVNKKGLHGFGIPKERLSQQMDVK